jgi:hypothetical protein
MDPRESGCLVPGERARGSESLSFEVARHFSYYGKNELLKRESNEMQGNERPRPWWTQRSNLAFRSQTRFATDLEPFERTPELRKRILPQ